MSRRDIPVGRSNPNMGRRRAAKGPSASDDELLEAAMAQAQSERDGMEASKAEASHSASAESRLNTTQARSQATARLVTAVESRAGPAEIRALLAEGAYVDGIDGQANRPLYVAAHSGHAEVVRLLLDGGADVNKATSEQRLDAAVHGSSSWACGGGAAAVG